MQEPKFTNGPWLFEEGQSRITKHWYGDKFVSIATVTPPEFHEDSVCGGREAGANGHLMAAAPELYAELSAAPILSKYHGARGFEADRFVSDYEAWMARRRAVVAKAHGES